MIKVSVCIPAYNGRKFIAETIRSVLNSTFQDYEIIVNDDASSDDTGKVVEFFSDPRIRFYQNNNNVGPVVNSNRAILRATGEYAGLLNHDDLYGPFWLTLAVSRLDQNPHIGWAATAYRHIDETGKTLAIISQFDKTGEIGRKEAFLEISRLNGLGPGFLARRKILEEVGAYDQEAGPSADNGLFLRLAARYPLFYAAGFPHTSWRRHGDNLTHRWPPVDQAREGLRMLNKIFDDPHLPRDLRRYRTFCVLRFCRKTKSYAEDFLRLNDQEAYHQVRQALRQAGFQE